MSDGTDLRELLDEWPYDPEKDVRVVTLPDGRQVIQVRLPLGIEQYEMDGRPDRRRPHGCESVLDHHLGRLAKARADGDIESFKLTCEDCAELFAEGVLYYYRYLHFFQLQEWSLTLRDTARNIRAFDLVKRYAERPEDSTYLEKWRPYITRIHAIASAMIELGAQNYGRAVDVIKRAVDTISSLEDIDDETFRFERERSLATLGEMANQLERSRPLGELETLERELGRAVEAEEFERAAELRDRILSLREESPRP